MGDTIAKREEAEACDEPASSINSFMAWATEGVKRNKKEEKEEPVSKHKTSASTMQKEQKYELMDAKQQTKEEVTDEAPKSRRPKGEQEAKKLVVPKEVKEQLEAMEKDTGADLGDAKKEEDSESDVDL